MNSELSETSNIKCHRCNTTQDIENFPVKPKSTERYLCCLRCRSKPRRIPPDTSNINFELAQRKIEPELYRLLRPDLMRRNFALQRDIRILQEEKTKLYDEFNNLANALGNYKTLDARGLVFLKRPPPTHNTFTWYLDNWNDVCNRNERFDTNVYDILPMQSPERIEYIKSMKTLLFKISLNIAADYKERHGRWPPRAKISATLFENGRVGKKNVYPFGEENIIFNSIRSFLGNRPAYVPPTGTNKN